MGEKLITLRHGAKAALLAFNFRWLSAHDMTIYFFQLPDSRDPWVMTTGRLNSFVREIIALGRFAVCRGAIL